MIEEPPSSREEQGKGDGGSHPKS